MRSVANAHIVERDTKLTGLGMLLDPEHFGAAYAVSRDGFTASPPSNCTLKYLRYKPGRRCIAVYDIERNLDNEVIVATAMTAETWSRQSTPQQRSLNGASALWIDKQQIQLHRFPNDRQLRSVAKIFDKSKSACMLRRILNETEAIDFETVQLRQLSYKPSRRFVAAAHCDGAPQYTLKFYTRHGYGSASQRALLRANAGAEPAMLNDRYRVIASRWIDGKNLSELLVRGFSPALRDTLFRVGVQLAKLQACDDAAFGSLPRQDPNAIALQLQELSTDLAFLLPDVGPLASRIAAYIAPRLSDSSPTLIHGDFYAKQVIVSSAPPQFIDFDDLAIGDSYRDVGNFVAKLHWSEMRGQLPSSDLHSMIEAFLAGYRKQQTWSAGRYQIQLAAGLLRCAPLAFRGGCVEWPSLTAEILRRAEAAIACEATGLALPVPKSPREADERLSLLLNPQTVSQALSDPTCDLTPLLANLSVNRAELLRWKPNRRCLIEYRFAKSVGQEKLQVLGKVRFKGADHRTPWLHKRLWAAGFNSEAETRVPQYLGAIPKMQLWFQEKIDARQITCDPRTAAADHARVAQALAALHQSHVEVDRRHGFREEMALLHDRLLSTAILHPEYADVLRQLQQRNDGLHVASESSRYCLIHRDFYFDQVLIDVDQVSLLDFDLACMGPPELDVGNYLAHLLEMGIRCEERAEYVHESCDRFLDAYLKSNPNCERVAIEAWTQLSLCRLIHISTLFTERQHTTLPLIHKCMALSGSSN